MTPDPGSRRQLLRAIGGLTGGIALGQVITIGAMPMLSRLYSPAEFGVLAAYVTLVAITSATGLAKLNVLIATASSEAQARVAFQAKNLPALVASALGGLASILLIPAASASEIVGNASAVCLSCYWVTQYQGRIALAANSGAFRQVRLSYPLRAIVTVCIQVGAGAAGFAAGLVTGDVLGRRASLSRLPGGRIVPWTRASMAGFRQHRTFVFQAIPASLLNAASSHALPLVVLSLYGAVEAGFFGVAQRLLFAPNQLVGQAVAQVYLSRFRLTAPAANRRLFWQLAIGLAAPSAAVVLLCTLAVPAVIAPLLGSAWAPVAGIAVVLAPLLGAQIIVSPLSHTLNALERGDLQLRWDIARVVVLALVVAAAVIAELSPQTFYALFSGSSVLLYVGIFGHSARLLAQACRIDRAAPDD